MNDEGGSQRFAGLEAPARSGLTLVTVQNIKLKEFTSLAPENLNKSWILSRKQTVSHNIRCPVVRRGHVLLSQMTSLKGQSGRRHWTLPELKWRLMERRGGRGGVGGVQQSPAAAHVWFHL